MYVIKNSAATWLKVCNYIVLMTGKGTIIVAIVILAIGP